jgi:hypothetical protein
MNSAFHGRKHTADMRHMVTPYDTTDGPDLRNKPTTSERPARETTPKDDD